MAISSFGGMSAMAPWLDRKYANMEDQTANQGVEAAATAGLKNVQAEMTPLDVVSQAGLRGAQANYANQNAAMHPLEVKSMAGLRGQQARQIGLSNEFGGFMSDYGLPEARRRAGINPNYVADLLFKRDGTAKVMKKGETRVTDETGNGHPRVDTVPAMLAEGEAVLNAGAAERMGRDEIRQLNKQGLRDMKMDSGERPVLKKGGRIGPFTGLAMGTNFARTSPDNDAEFHPTEYTEPRDPEHDAEHMAQPLSSGGMGMGLRCGTAKVMKYADGTSDAGAGGHGSPDSPSAVNMAGTMGGRGRTMGAKFVGGRGYADGIDHVPAESESELDNFQRQRDRNQIDEAVPAGTPVGFEAVGQQASVSPSRDTARLRQMFDLTAQGFASGTADVQALQPARQPGVLYAVEGANFVERAFGAAKDLGGRAAEGLRGLAQTAPVDLGTVGATAAPASAAPSSAAAAAIAARQEAAQQAARAAMGESPAMAAQATRTATSAMPGATTAAPTGLRAAASLPIEMRPGAWALEKIGGSLPEIQTIAKGAKAVSNLALRAATPVAMAAEPGMQAYNEYESGFMNDPNVPAVEKAKHAAGVGTRALFTGVGGLLGAGGGGMAGAATGPAAPVAVPLLGTAGAMAGGRAGKAFADEVIPAQTDALRAWKAAQPSKDLEANTALVEQDARKSYHNMDKAANAQSAKTPGQPQLSLRGLAMLGTMMGHEGASRALQSLDAEDKARISARAAAASSANSWMEGVGKGLFMTTDDKGKSIEDQATLSQFRNFVNDRLSEKGTNVQASTPEQRAALERQLVNDFRGEQVVQKAMQEHGRGAVNRMFGGVEPRGRLTPVSSKENLSLAGALTQPYSIGSALSLTQRGVKLVDSMGNSFLVPESEYTKDPVTGLTDPVRELQLKSLRSR